MTEPDPHGFATKVNPYGDPLVAQGFCPYCSKPERKGGQRVGMSIPFECGTVLNPRTWGHGLVAYEPEARREGENCAYFAV